MAYKLKFTLDYLPPIGLNQRVSWHKRHKETKLADMLVWKAVGNKRPPKPLERVKLKLTRASSSPPDYDGLVQSFKNIVDALVTCRVIKNDKIENTGKWDCEWIKAKQKAGFIEIEVIEDIAESCQTHTVATCSQSELDLIPKVHSEYGNGL
jgi:hypothetical protein